LKNLCCDGGNDNFLLIHPISACPRQIVVIIVQVLFLFLLFLVVIFPNLDLLFRTLALTQFAHVHGHESYRKIEKKKKKRKRKRREKKEEKKKEEKEGDLRLVWLVMRTNASTARTAALVSHVDDVALFHWRKNRRR
jgi:hypothetical protein